MIHQTELFPASDYCQRWTSRRPTWRHTSEGGFDPRGYDVGVLAEGPAKAFICANHYSGSYVAASQRYGLWARGGQLVGAAILSVPVTRAVLTTPFPELAPFTESLELGRFVLLDDVPANGESWFLGQVFRMAAASGLRGIVSFSDPTPRSSTDGSVIFPGHVGTIYQATNAVYAGRGYARTLRLLPDGRVLNERALAKVRSGDRGTRYVEELLESYGATPRSGRDPSTWVKGVLEEIGVRSLRHPGNHRYLFRLGADRKRIAVGVPSYPYPKGDQQ